MTGYRPIGAGMNELETVVHPGLYQDEQGYVWLKQPPDALCLVGCVGGGGGNTPLPSGVGDILYSPDGATWAILAIGAQDEVLTVDTGVPVWEPGGTSVVAGDALQFTGNTLDVLVDGLTIQVNGSNQLEIISSGVLTDAVIVNPATDARNVIQPTLATVIPLTLRGQVAQSDDLFRIQDSAAGNAFRVIQTGQQAQGIGTYSITDYAPGLAVGHYTVGVLIARGGDGFYDALSGPAFTPGAVGNVVGVFPDINVQPTANQALGDHYAQGGSMRLTGDKFVYRLRGMYSEAMIHGAGKAAGTGNQINFMAGGSFYAESNDTSTGDIGQMDGVNGYAYHTGDGHMGIMHGGYFEAGPYQGAGPILTRVFGVESWAVTYASSGTAIPLLVGVRGAVYSSGQAVTEGRGLWVSSPTGIASIVTNYGLKVDSQSGAGTKSYGVFVGGGFNEFRAGVATEIPLTLRGFAAQSANLFVTEDSAGNDLVAISSAGVINFGTSADTNLYRSAADVLKTDDSFAVGGSMTFAPSGFWDGAEISVPATPAANHGRLFFRDSGGGLTQLVAVFPSGNTVVVASDF